MRALLFLLAIWCVSMNADNTMLLDVQMRMLPKIMALDTQLPFRNGTSAVLAVVYNEGKRNSAQSIANAMNRMYEGRVGSVPFTAIALSADDLKNRRDITFVYTLQTDSSSLEQIAKWGSSNGVPTFSSTVSGLDAGIFGSIAIERNTVIYINKNVMKSGKYRFNDYLYQIARFVE